MLEQAQVHENQLRALHAERLAAFKQEREFQDRMDEMEVQRAQLARERNRVSCLVCIRSYGVGDNCVTLVGGSRQARGGD